jgi:hypothetical protein
VDAYSGSPSSEETGGASSPISRLFGSWFGLSETGSTPKEASVPESRSFLSRLFGGTREKTSEATTQSAPRAAKPVLRRTRIAASKPGPKLKPLPDPPARPLGSQAAQEETGKQEAERGGLLVGAQPVVPAGGFQSR